MDLGTNQLVLIGKEGEKQLWRVLSVTGRDVFIARTALSVKDPETIKASLIVKSKLIVRWVTLDELDDWHAEGEAELASVNVGPKRQPTERFDAAELKEARRNDLEESRRLEIMSGFLDAASFQRAINVGGGFGPLIREAIDKAAALEERATRTKSASAEGSESLTRSPKKYKSTVYYWLKLLINFGFVASALSTLHENCGASGKAREYGGDSGKLRPGRKAENERLDRGVSATQYIPQDKRAAIVAVAKGVLSTGGSMAMALKKALLVVYAKGSEWKNGEWQFVLPEIGFYPNNDQMRFVIEADLDNLDRLAARMSTSHYKKNHRALRGTARDGVLGAGHRYNIDSTIDNTFLRSGIDLKWLVGRPIVYWVLDSWSTAVVGLYACLHSPAWESAACAVLLSCIGSDDFKAFFGVDRDLGLITEPGICATLAADRGEYLSAAAKLAAQRIGTSMIHGESYRADLRGIVERFHRVPQGYSLGFLPGSFDARNAQLELSRSTYGAAVLTLAEYFVYLLNFARAHNLTANRESIAPAELIANGFAPTPAGLWEWSHWNGTGYRKVIEKDDLIRALMRPYPVSIQANGAHLGKLRYQSEQIERLVAASRNFGRETLTGYCLPSMLSQICVEPPSCKQLIRLPMSAGQRIQQTGSMFDLLDAGSVFRAARPAQAHRTAIEAVNALGRNEKLIEVGLSRLQNSTVGVKAARDAEHLLSVPAVTPTNKAMEAPNNHHLASLDELMAEDLALS